MRIWIVCSQDNSDGVVGDLEMFACSTEAGAEKGWQDLARQWLRCLDEVDPRDPNQPKPDTFGDDRVQDILRHHGVNLWVDLVKLDSPEGIVRGPRP